MSRPAIEPARHRTRFIIAWLLALLCTPAAGRAGSICGHAATATVAIMRGEARVASFSVALADTPLSQRRGLMRCPSLPPGTGMLFVYPEAGQRVFWMKDTPIELAIIFISADGRIASIARGQPGSLDHIHSPESVGHVLEVNYPEGRRLSVGDRVQWRMAAAIDNDAPDYRP